MSNIFTFICFEISLIFVIVFFFFLFFLIIIRSDKILKKRLQLFLIRNQLKVLIVLLITPYVVFNITCLRNGTVNYFDIFLPINLVLFVINLTTIVGVIFGQKFIKYCRYLMSYKGYVLSNLGVSSLLKMFFFYGIVFTCLFFLGYYYTFIIFVLFFTLNYFHMTTTVVRFLLPPNVVIKINNFKDTFIEDSKKFDFHLLVELDVLGSFRFSIFFSYIWIHISPIIWFFCFRFYLVDGGLCYLELLVTALYSFILCYIYITLLIYMSICFIFNPVIEKTIIQVVARSVPYLVTGGLLPATIPNPILPSPMPYFVTKPVQNAVWGMCWEDPVLPYTYAGCKLLDPEMVIQSEFYFKDGTTELCPSKLKAKVEALQISSSQNMGEGFADGASTTIKKEYKNVIDLLSWNKSKLSTDEIFNKSSFDDVEIITDKEVHREKFKPVLDELKKTIDRIE
jgi:hypothetical protein